MIILELCHSLCICLGCRCDICQILRGWAKQRHLVKTKFILIGDMSQDHSVLSDQWKHVLPRSPDVLNNIRSCGMPPRLLGHLLADPRLVLWVVASSQFTAHPKIIAVPLGLFHPQKVKAAMKKRVGKRRKHLVGDTDGTFTNDTRKRSKIFALVSAILPKSAFVRIPRNLAPAALDVSALTKYSSKNKQGQPTALFWFPLMIDRYWQFTSISKFILSPPGYAQFYASSASCESLLPGLDSTASAPGKRLRWEPCQLCCIRPWTARLLASRFCSSTSAHCGWTVNLMHDLQQT